MAIVFFFLVHRGAFASVLHASYVYSEINVLISRLSTYLIFPYCHPLLSLAKTSFLHHFCIACVWIMWGRGSSPFTFLPGTGDFTCKKSECPANAWGGGGGGGGGGGPGVSNDWCITCKQINKLR